MESTPTSAAAVTAAALTVYDMCKAIDKTMVVGGIRLIEKTGGQSGPFPQQTKPGSGAKGKR